MAQIGQFIRTQAGYAGRVRTLSLDLAVVFVPAHNVDVESAPDYRIRLGDEDGIEIGAGLLQTGDRAGAYISVILDDPSLAQPIRARLFQSDESGRDWGLHWTRPKKRDDQDRAQD
ncbi:MAG: DUF736 domain-containing protein [Mesorhizobium sp.]|uniref:DUF736 domain-containing protein n=1 Tax=Mesorhizobium sp. TaxID=1871066 RepID=UPI000FE83F7A|nr:DUF736 domain-containing protein [Mesorhizobium sp.]RWQ37070.1 MAG: DUF736 domain-containing protein [Mesorhizobium sp.]